MERLEAELPGWLQGRRWFGGKARRIDGAAVVDVVPLGPARVVLARVSYREGAPELYALPLRAGALEDAAGDPPFARALLAAIAGGARFAGRDGEVVAFSSPALAAAVAGAPEPRLLGAEQSNTSLRFGDRFVLKLFRRTEPGPNPDLEVGVYLTDVARFPHTPPVLGGLEYRPRDGAGCALGILQGFVANEGDAWAFTLRQVAAFLAARGDDEVLAGASVEAAALLGRRTAGLHLALAAHPEVEAFRPEPFTPGDARALAGELSRAVGEQLGLLRRRLDALSAEQRALAEQVLAREPDLAARGRRLLESPPAGFRLRTHGDYHLGQVLWTGRDFVVIDFEGEPARPLAARRAKGSPLRDVAGMIRSYHYAAFQGLADAGPTGGAERRARGWYRRVSAAFLRAYLDAARPGGVLPPTPGATRDLLDVHLVEKAAYELGYELNNRPGWVGLPLQGLLDLVEPAAAAAGGLEDGVAKDGAKRAPKAAREGPRAAAARPPGVLAHGGPGDTDRHLWNEGTNYRAYRTMGAHLGARDGVEGTSFAVWAPNAERVSVIGDFNGWDKDAHPLNWLGDSGIWQGFIPGVREGAVYKYHLRSRHGGHTIDKADPFGFMHETAPGTQSIVRDLSHAWGDEAWMRARHAPNGLHAPMSVYEVHLGSWRRAPDEDRSLTYRELAPLLADYAQEMGFTHVELMPITEHPFYGSWGYQTTGYFAPTSRYGTPQDFMSLVDTLHQRGIGVILDWVPSHFPTDGHGLAYFDGTHLFEHADRRQGHQPDWDSFIFNYGRNEVRSFLLSSALFWLDAYHLDGLRVDAVASMLYLDYSRKHGEWIPNKYGGRENLEAIGFLRTLNEVVYREYPDVQTIAEESTSWPMVSRPLYVGGLGFGMKWDMGWMHDTLAYMGHEPVYRKFHHNEVTFRMMYAFSENFVLPLSHDEVVHGKGSLLARMPGVDREKFANLRLLLGYMWAEPGKKLLFMGGEIAQGQEWSHDRGLDWHLLGYEQHAGVKSWVRDLNRLLREEPALHAHDFDGGGFEWVDCNDAEASVLSLLRKGSPGDPEVLVVLNFTPVARHSYRVGVPRGGFWREVLNSDATLYGGSGWGNLGGQEAAPVGAHGRLHSLALTLPPLSALFFRPDRA